MFPSCRKLPSRCHLRRGVGTNGPKDEGRDNFVPGVKDPSKAPTVGKPLDLEKQLGDCELEELEALQIRVGEHIALKGKARVDVSQALAQYLQGFWWHCPTMQTEDKVPLISERSRPASFVDDKGACEDRECSWPPCGHCRSCRAEKAKTKGKGSGEERECSWPLL